MELESQPSPELKFSDEDIGPFVDLMHSLDLLSASVSTPEVRDELVIDRFKAHKAYIEARAMIGDNPEALKIASVGLVLGSVATLKGRDAVVAEAGDSLPAYKSAEGQLLGDFLQLLKAAKTPDGQITNGFEDLVSEQIDRVDKILKNQTEKYTGQVSHLRLLTLSIGVASSPAGSFRQNLFSRISEEFKDK